LEGEGSRLFWKLLEIIEMVKRVFGATCKVKYCVENVASMDETARRTISGELHIVPIKLDPADCMPFSRPRFAWVSEEVHQMDELELWTEKEYVRAYIQADSVIEDRQWMRPGWKRYSSTEGVKYPTFMKAINKAPTTPSFSSRTEQGYTGDGHYVGAGSIQVPSIPVQSWTHRTMPISVGEKEAS